MAARNKITSEITGYFVEKVGLGAVWSQ